MARAMNAVGFHHPQWMKFIMSSKVEKIDNITEKEDGEEKERGCLGHSQENAYETKSQTQILPTSQLRRACNYLPLHLNEVHVIRNVISRCVARLKKPSSSGYRGYMSPRKSQV